MKNALLISLVALLPLALTAAQDPVITSIQPNSAPTTGGTNVVITGANFALPPNFACILPCPTTVLFGATEVIPKEATDTRLDVVAPPHPAGVVDITVKTGDGRAVYAWDAFTYTDTAEAQYTKLLLPVYIEKTLPGGYGSQWKTSLWLRNNGSTKIQLAPWTCPQGEACPAVFPLIETLDPGETLHDPVLGGPVTLPGRLIYATRDAARNLSAGLRMSDTSRLATIGGTEVPVVREDELYSSAVQLHNVPLAPQYRIMLRIYDVDLSQAQFRVSIFEERDGAASQTPLGTVTMNAATTETAPFRSLPAYAQLSDFAPLLSGAQLPPGPLPIRVTIEPLTAGSRFWAFATITSNETQFVTIVTPQ